MSEPRFSPVGGYATESESLRVLHRPDLRLTPRQHDVLRLLCEGMPNKLISRSLDISCATVKVHVSSIFRALKVSSRLEAVVAARAIGLTSTAGQAPLHAVRNPSFPSPVGRLMLDQLVPRLRLISESADAD